jgi:hypothetical protein
MVEGERQSVRVVCACNPRALLVRVRNVLPGPRQVEPRHAIDGDWVGDWRSDFREAMVEAGDGSWDEFVAAGRRPSFDGWSVRCRRANCARVVEGHIDDLVTFVRAALESGERQVVLTSETLAAACLSDKATR